MKILKPILWILIPSAIIWATYFLVVSFLDNASNTTIFASEHYYYELFMKDDIFSTALKNTLKTTILPALTVSVATYLIMVILKAKPAVMYGGIFIFATLAFMFARFIIFDMDFYFNPFGIFGASQCGIICCFICFIINVIVKRFTKKEVKESVE